MLKFLLHGGAVVVALFALAMLSWALSNRPDWWRVRTELYGFLWFAASVVLFFAFNLFAFSYLPGHFLWFLLSFVAFGWFSFRIHEKFDSSSPILTGAEGAANAHPSSLPAVVDFQSNPKLFIGLAALDKVEGPKSPTVTPRRFTRQRVLHEQQTRNFDIPHTGGNSPPRIHKSSPRQN
jgi:hypothetical protein